MVEPVEPTPIAVEAIEEEEDGERSDRGNLVVAAGDTGYIVNANEEEVLQFTVKSIKPTKCNGQWADPAENGQFVAVEMDAVASKDFQPYDAMLSSYQWTYYSDKGTRFNGDLGSSASHYCLDEAEVIPSDLGPGDKVTGKVVLDVPDGTKGMLVFEPASGNGFEYTLGK